MSYQCTEEQFLKDVANHQMITLHDDGIYRHIRFEQPDSGNMYFDLVTWPGYLAYSGDMGCYVFSRLTDMFQFFRTDREYKKRGGRNLAINLGYWSEKLQAADGNRHGGNVTEFSEDTFNRAVIEYLVGWIRENAHQTTKDERRELWDSVMHDVIGADGDSGGYRKQAAVHDFSHNVNSIVDDFYFMDFWESDFTEYTHRFVWCCYALAWGVEQYDNAKERKK